MTSSMSLTGTVRTYLPRNIIPLSHLTMGCGAGLLQLLCSVKRAYRLPQSQSEDCAGYRNPTLASTLNQFHSFSRQNRHSRTSYSHPRMRSVPVDGWLRSIVKWSEIASSYPFVMFRQRSTPKGSSSSRASTTR